MISLFKHRLSSLLKTTHINISAVVTQIAGNMQNWGITPEYRAHSTVLELELGLRLGLGLGIRVRVRKMVCVGYYRVIPKIVM